MISCKNCTTEFDGKFCPECGQKAKTSRISIRQVIRDLRDQVIHFDKGFLFTIRELALRPGYTIREYLDGKRVRHVKPIKFMVWATAISFLISHCLGYQERMVERFQQEPGTTEQSRMLAQKVLNFATAHPSLLMFLIIPTVALSGWLFFHKKRLNYAEHFTINAFLMGELSLLSVATNLGYMSWNTITVEQITVIGVLQWLVWVVYFGWAYSQVFEEPKRIFIRFKGAFVLVTGYMFLAVAMAALVSTILYFFKPQIEAWLGNG